MAYPGLTKNSSSPSVSTITVALPTHTTNDVVFILFDCLNAGTVTDPTGWQSLGAFAAGGAATRVYYKRATSGAIADPTITWTGGFSGMASAVVVHGANVTSDISAYDTHTSASTGGALKVTTSPMTITAADSLIMLFVAGERVAEDIFLAAGSGIELTYYTDFGTGFVGIGYTYAPSTTTQAFTAYTANTVNSGLAIIAVAIADGGGGVIKGYPKPDFATPIIFNAGSHEHTLSVIDPTNVSFTPQITTVTNGVSGTTQTAQNDGFEGDEVMHNKFIAPCGWGQRGQSGNIGFMLAQGYQASAGIDLSSSLLKWSATKTYNYDTIDNMSKVIAFGDGTNASAFLFDGIDSELTYSTQSFILDTAATGYEIDTFGAGSLNWSSVQDFIFLTKPLGYSGQYYYMGALYKLGTLEMIGGSSTFPCSFADASKSTDTGAVNTVTAHGGQTSGQFFALQKVSVGDGTNTVTWSSRNQSVEFPQAYNYATGRIQCQVDAGALSLTVNASASCDINMSSTTLNFGNYHQFIVASGSSTSATYNFDGLTVLNSEVTLKDLGADAYSGAVFSGCNEINYHSLSTASALGGATISNCAEDYAITVSTEAEFNALRNVIFRRNNFSIKITGNQTGTWSAAGITVSGGTGSYDIEYTGTTDFTIEFDIGSGFSQGRVDNSAAVTAGNTGLTVSTPTQATRINPDVTISASPTGSMRYFRPAISEQTPAGSASGDFLDYEYADTTPIDIEVVEQGYVPVNQQAVTPINGTLTITMDLDEAYNASHSLAIVTHYTYDRATKAFAILVDQNAFDVRSSMADTIRTNSSYYNTPLLLEAKPGGKRIDLIDGATITSMATWKGAGMERYDAADAINPVEKWYAVQSVNNISGAAVVYRQTNSGDFTVGSLTNSVFDEALQFYSDPDHDGTPATENNSYLLIKALRVGYRQARNDVVAGNGGASLKADLYTIGLAPTAHDYAGGPIDLSATMTLVAGGTVGGKTFAYKWVDAGTNSGTDIADWINYMGATSPNGVIPGGTGLRWAEMPDMVIYVTGGVETAQGYREGATPTLVGFYMERAGADHPDMVRAQADDGTYYTPATTVSINNANLVSGWHVKIVNETQATTLFNADLTGSLSESFLFGPGQQIESGDTIRYYAARVSGTNYWEPVTNSQIASGGNITFTESPTVWTDVETWGWDSTPVTGDLTEFAADGTNIDVDINDPDGDSKRTKIVAFWAWMLTQSSYIEEFWGAYTVFSPSHIRQNKSVVDVVIHNITSPPIAVVFSDNDVRYYRDDFSTPYDTTGAAIFMDYTGVPDYTTITVSGSNVITGDIADIPATIKSDMAADPGPYKVNVKEVNDIPLAGNGTTTPVGAA